MENQKLNPQIAAMKNAYLTGQVVSDREIALASMTVLDDYRWVPEPTPPPEVIKFNSSDPGLKGKMRKNPAEYSVYWENNDVKNYYDTRNVIRNLNERNKRWLEWMKKILPEHEVELDLQLHKYKDSYHQDIGMEQPQW